MATIYGFCGDCDQKIEMSVGQSVFRRELCWHISYICPHCGNQIEVDEDGIPPEDIRNAILAVEGRWKLVVQETNNRRIIAMKVLRAALNLTLDEVITLKKTIPGVVTVGTKAEVHKLQQILNDNDLNAWIEEE